MRQDKHSRNLQQYFVRALDGRTRTVCWEWDEGPSSTSSSTSLSLTRIVQAEVEGIESDTDEIELRLSDGRLVCSSCVPDAGSTLTVTLPLFGGKGGFGKAIRDMGRSFKGCADKGDCRDAQGRRIRQRDVAQAAQRFKEEETQRELAKVGESYVKKANQEALRIAKEGCVDEEEERRSQRRVAKETASRVRDAVEESKKGHIEAGRPPAKKKAKVFFGDEDSEGSSSEDEG